MIKFKKSNNQRSADRVQGGPPKPLGGGAPVLTPHLLYRDWAALKIDGRSFYAKRKKELIGKLLEGFSTPAPGPAEILANITASNLLLALRMEMMLRAGEVAPSAFQDFLRLTNSNSANLVRLWNMAKDGGPVDRVPSLQEYLDGLKQANEPDPPEPSPDPAPAKRTLF